MLSATHRHLGDPLRLGLLPGAVLSISASRTSKWIGSGSGSGSAQAQLGWGQGRVTVRGRVMVTVRVRVRVRFQARAAVQLFIGHRHALIFIRQVRAA